MDTDTTSTQHEHPAQPAKSGEFLGAISIGSNDLHLLVATSDGASRFESRADERVFAELLVQLDGHVLPPDGLSHALADVARLVRLARSAGAGRVIAIATEALREAANGRAFIALLAATFDIEAVLLSGEEEAALDYCWATFPSAAAMSTTPTSATASTVSTASSGTPPAPEADALPLLVIDSGGGSTQLVLGEGPAPAWSTSLPIGAGSLTRQFIAHDPPKTKELQALDAHVATLVGALPRPLAPRAAVLMGGSADHLLRLAAHPRRGQLTHADLERALALLHQKTADRIARDERLPVERVRLLAAGATILAQVLDHYGIEAARVRPEGIRGGLVVCYARGGDRWRETLRALRSPAVLATRRAARVRRAEPASAPSAPATRKTPRA
jgi:exopolyphosphatase/guanosine-5'-triphosphate,3'-diphosphate pyrophosphatase